MGDPKRIALVAADLVAHFEKRVEAMDGKAMIASVELKSVWLAISSAEEGRGSQRAARLPGHFTESHREWVCVMVLLAGWQVDRSFSMESTDRQGVDCGLKGQKVVGSGFPTLRKTQTGVGWPPLKARETKTDSRSASLKGREAKRSSVRRPRRLGGGKLPAVCLARRLNGGKRTSVSYF